WLGIEWEDPVLRQSERFDAYREALDRLEGMGLLYPCFCTRREIAAEVDRAVSAPHGPEGPHYPGTCRALDTGERARRLQAGQRHALRLDTAAAARVVGALSWRDRDRGEVPLQPGLLGDVVLARVDAPVSYHLAVTVDDAAQGVSLVTRGEDLLASTHVHRLLLGLLDLPVPQWRHHRLILDAQGRKFSKRDDSVTLCHLRESGATASELRRELGF
ncbi:MAG: tRNA glutamyl-Q(34) synthetase GluQRS, partial [Verrucomicrobiales bacterium]